MSTQQSGNTLSPDSVTMPQHCSLQRFHNGQSELLALLPCLRI